MKSARFNVACVSAFALLAGSASAQDIHQGDIALGIDGDRLAVGDGSADPQTGDLLWDECTFGVALEAFARTPNPGFDTNIGAFAPNRSIAYAHRAALRKWNGQNFDAIPAETMRMSFGPLRGVSTPAADPVEPVVGPFVGVSSNGEYHNHFTFRIELDGAPATGPESQGIFLAELEMRIDDGSLLPTEPFFLVFDNGADSSEFDAAVDYARSVISGCGEAPCPADTNGDGGVTPADFNAWILAFNTQAPACDQNGDGLCSPADFNAWILNFNQGCP